MPRLQSINGDSFRDDESRYDGESVTWITEAMQSAADSGATLVEIQFRGPSALYSGFMSQFRAADEEDARPIPVTTPKLS